MVLGIDGLRCNVSRAREGKSEYTECAVSEAIKVRGLAAANARNGFEIVVGTRECDEKRIKRVSERATGTFARRVYQKSKGSVSVGISPIGLMRTDKEVEGSYIGFY